MSRWLPATYRSGNCQTNLETKVPSDITRHQVLLQGHHLDLCIDSRGLYLEIFFTCFLRNVPVPPGRRSSDSLNYSEMTDDPQSRGHVSSRHTMLGQASLQHHSTWKDVLLFSNRVSSMTQENDTKGDYGKENQRGEKKEEEERTWVIENPCDSGQNI